VNNLTLQPWLRQRWQIGLIVAICVLILWPFQTLHAGIKTCTLDDGSVVFQDTPCPVIPTEPTEQKTNVSKAPLGLDTTWFETPAYVPARAVCTASGCRCDSYTEKFDDGVAWAVADALYLDGAWERLNSALAKMEQPNTSSDEYASLTLERDEAACQILMSQTTLQKYGQKVFDDLKAKSNLAKQSGMTNPDECAAGDITVCKNIDTIALYDRIVFDINALGSTGTSKTDTAMANVDATRLAELQQLELEIMAELEAELNKNQSNLLDDSLVDESIAMQQASNDSSASFTLSPKSLALQQNVIETNPIKLAIEMRMRLASERSAPPLAAAFGSGDFPSLENLPLDF